MKDGKSDRANKVEKPFFPKRRTLKKEARSCLHAAFIVAIVLCIIVAVFQYGPFNMTPGVKSRLEVISKASKSLGIKPLENAAKFVKKTINKFDRATSFGDQSRHGLISVVYHDSMRAGGSIIESAFRSAAKKFFGGAGENAFVFIIPFVLSILFPVFVLDPLRVGVRRFFLEELSEEDRKKKFAIFPYLTFAYRSGNFMNIVWTMFMRKFYLLLWALTLVGYPIKYYAYSQVYFILARDPGIKTKQVFRESIELMRGRKMKLFALDISFMPHRFLGYITLNLLKYFYVDPYILVTKANLYKQISGDDFALAPSKWTLRSFNLDYERDYSLVNLGLMFFLFSFIGYVWEVMIIFFEHGVIVNRGSLYGPWILIYGSGGVLVVILLKRFRAKPIVTFFLSMFVCGVTEYIGATLLALRHVKYWDYSGYFLNIQGRVCLEGLIAFGTLSMIGIYIFAPYSDNLINKIPARARIILLAALSALFIADVIIAHFYPHTGKYIGG